MNSDFEDIKLFATKFITQNKKVVMILFSVVFLFSLFFAFVMKNNYERNLSSSNMLIDYIQGKNEIFLEKKHKKGYETLKNIIIFNKNPSIEGYNELAKFDDYVFKNLFYFSRFLYFKKKDAFHSYYATQKNPWSKLILECEVLQGEKDSSVLKNKGEYLTTFLIGKGLKC